MENAADDEHGQDAGQQVGNRLGQQDAGKAEEGSQGRDGREEDDALAAEGKGQRAGGVAHRLADAGGNQGNAHQERAQLHEADHFHAGFDHRRIIQEQPHQQRGGEEKNHGEQGAEPGLQQVGEPQGLPEALPVPAAMAVAEEGLAAEGETDQRHHADHVDPAGDAHGGDLRVAVGLQRAVGDHQAEAEHDIGHRGRNADPEDFPDILFRDPDLPEVQGNDAALFPDHPYVQGAGQEIAQAGGQRGAGGAHVQREDEQGIQRDVRHGSGDAAPHAQGGEALGPQLVVRDHGEDNEGCADGDPGEIGGGVDEGIVVRAQQAQDRRAEQQHHRHEDQPGREGGVHAEGGNPAGILILLFPQQAGHQRAAAQSPDIPHGDGQHENRGTDGYAGHQVRIPGQGNEPGVHHVVDHAQQHGQDHRNGQLQVSPGYRRVFKKIALQGDSLR